MGTSSEGISVSEKTQTPANLRRLCQFSPPNEGYVILAYNLFHGVHKESHLSTPEFTILSSAVNQRNSGLFLSQRVISSIAQEDLN
jgi:hypothetical protein